MAYFQTEINISEFIGKTFSRIEVGQDEIVFVADDFAAKMYHQQDCCESVYIEDINGDIQALVGNVIVAAEEVSNQEESDYGRQTWTFYKLTDSAAHYVTIRWLGESNGYYSESVEIVQLATPPAA